MDFDFTQEQNMLRESIARLVSQKYDFDTRRAVVKSASGWRPELWQDFVEMGLTMAPFPEDLGGLGGNALETLIAMEEFGKGLVVEPYLQTVVQAGGILARHGSPDQQSRFLAAIIGGEAIFAPALDEPRSRHDLHDVQTSARAEGDSYVLDGRKAVVLGAPFASHLLVSARESGARRDEAGISLFIVARDAQGLSTREYTNVDGLRAAEVSLENVRVSAGERVGAPGAAFAILDEMMDHSIAALCAEAIGLMKPLHAMTLDYSKTRKQFGVPIGSFQVLQHRLVDMFMWYEQAVSMTYMATLRLDAPAKERAMAASAAKVFIGKAARFIGQEAIQIHGGIGMTDEYKAGHYFKRLSMIESQMGSSDWHQRRYTRLAGLSPAR